MLGDGLAGLARLEPGSVDLLLSDLPAGITEAPFDEAPDLERFVDLARRAVGPEGVAVFLAGNFRFANAVVNACGRWFRHDLVWEKTSPTGFLNAKVAPLRAHELILVCGAARYRPQYTRGHAPYRRREGYLSANYGGAPTASESDGRRYARSVLRFASVANGPGGGRVHPQQKPIELMRWLVRAYSRRGGLVVDPFAGSGSTGVAALLEGRRFRGWEREERFALAARARLAEASRR